MARPIFTSVGTIKLGEEISAADGKQTSSEVEVSLISLHIRSIEI